MKIFTSLLICCVLYFLSIQLAFANPQYYSLNDDIVKKFDDCIRNNSFEFFSKNGFSDWKEKIQILMESVRLLEETKQELYYQECYFKCISPFNFACYRNYDCNSWCSDNFTDEHKNEFSIKFSEKFNKNLLTKSLPKTKDSRNNEFVQTLRVCTQQPPIKSSIEPKSITDLNQVADKPKNDHREKPSSPSIFSNNYIMDRVITTISIIFFMATLIFIFLYKQEILSSLHKLKNQLINYFSKKSLTDNPTRNAKQSSKLKDTRGDVVTASNSTVALPKPNVNPFIDQEKKLENIATNILATNKFWWGIAASVIGKSHKDNVPPLPCQDSHCLEDIGKGWGIAVVCDGAGSAEYSHFGSRFVAEEVVRLLKNNKAPNFFPSLIKKDLSSANEEWHKVVKKVFKEIRGGLEKYAHDRNIEAKTLACTVIVVVFSPIGLLVTHIGDGRGGYRDSKGEWKSLLTPFKGEEATETVFITSDIWNNLDKFVESRVITEPATAFVIMSDGCENHCFQTHTPDSDSKDFHLVDVNKPHAKFFEPLFKTMSEAIAKPSENSEEIKEKWGQFIESGTEGLKNEPDDKTMLIGILRTGKQQ